MALRIIVLLCSFLLVPFLHAAEFDHSDWDTLLKNHVRVLGDGVATQVDYENFAANRDALKDYLKRLSAVSREAFDSWSADDQLAFLINSYNSWTVNLILTKFPDLESIKELGSLFQSPWKKKFIPLLEEKRSLDDIEHELIRGSDRYNDPRIHFAVNCASVGCPALRTEAYRGGVLQLQLDEATSLFLQDRSRNRLNGKVLEMSSVLKWYREDFEKGWKGVTTLQQFLASHAEDLGMGSNEAASVMKGSIKIKFLDYDWKLNRIP